MALTWDDSAIPYESAPEAVARIVNARLLIDRFGDWPSFADAEVISLFFDRGNSLSVFETKAWDQRVPQSLIAELYVFETGEAQGSAARKDSRVVLRFTDFGRFELDGFNYQNAMVGLIVTTEYAHPKWNKDMFAVRWGGTAMPHEVSFTCEEIEVLSVHAMST